MFGSAMLDVAIGMIFVYVLISVICTALREGIESWLKTRAAYLEYGIRELLHDKKAEGIANHLYLHPLIFSLFSGTYTKRELSEQRPGHLAKGSNLPSYIPAKNFALALLDIAARGPDTAAVSNAPQATPLSLDAIRTNLSQIQNPAVQRVLLTALDTAQGDLAKIQASLEEWYNSNMERVSGWYKRSTQWILFWIGVVVAVGLNVNTLTIADYLYRNADARAALVARAQIAATDSTRRSQEANQVLASLNLPIGWSAGWGAGKEGFWNNVLAPVLGWLMTALAATLGAPFWFDVLNRVTVLRSTVKPQAPRSPGSA